MKRRKWFYKALIMSVPFLTICGCKDDKNEGPTPVEGVELVTFLGRDAEGSRWEMQRAQESAPIALSASETFAGRELKEGRRYAVYYTAALEDTAKRPMPVNILQIGIIAFDTLRLTDATKLAELPDAQTKVVSQWRTGDFINVQAETKYDGEAWGYSLAADSATLMADTVECRLFRLGKPSTENYVYRRSYGSFFIGDAKRDNNQIFIIKQQ